MGVTTQRGGRTTRPAAGSEFRLAYDAACNASIRRRLALTVLALATVLAAGIVLEGWRHPERVSLLLSLYLSELAVGAASVAIAWLSPWRAHARWAACGFGVLMSLLVATHDVLVDRALLSAAMAQI